MLELHVNPMPLICWNSHVNPMPLICWNSHIISPICLSLCYRDCVEHAMPPYFVWWSSLSVGPHAAAALTRPHHERQAPEPVLYNGGGGLHLHHPQTLPEPQAHWLWRTRHCLVSHRINTGTTIFIFRNLTRWVAKPGGDHVFISLHALPFHGNACPVGAGHRLLLMLKIPNNFPYHFHIWQDWWPWPV